ncbi:hypothetical protein M3Y94_01070500 [Aphelenchoides besseyi]|nr:hypothetical protein M3Y94_01070500 [Aphelenchoides besseyi]
MQLHGRPWNWVLVILAALLFICSVFCVRQVVSEMEQMSSELKTEVFTVFVFTLQITTTLYCVFSFLFVFKLARQRSYGCNSKVLNKMRTTGFGILGLSSLVIALIVTLFQFERFGSIGVFLLLDAFISLVLCFVFWQREQLINDFVERILHVNSLSSNFLTEQNARDLFKLNECDQGVYELRSIVSSLLSTSDCSRNSPFRILSPTKMVKNHPIDFGWKRVD